MFGVGGFNERNISQIIKQTLSTMNWQAVGTSDKDDIFVTLSGDQLTTDLDISCF